MTCQLNKQDKWLLSTHAQEAAAELSSAATHAATNNATTTTVHQRDGVSARDFDRLPNLPSGPAPSPRFLPLPSPGRSRSPCLSRHSTRAPGPNVPTDARTTTSTVAPRVSQAYR